MVYHGVDGKEYRQLSRASRAADALSGVAENTEKTVPEPLSKYDEREVRLVTEYGEMFRGECNSFPAEFGMHELGREEEGVQIDSFVFYRSDIRSMESI